MRLSQEQINRQIELDRDEFLGLSTDVRDALKLQVHILRRSPLISRRHAEEAVQTAA